MAPQATAVTGQLRQIVHYHLDNISYENALFFAERLLAHDPRASESAYLVALSHFRLGDYRSAHEISRPAGHRGIHVGCAYVFAQTCLILEKAGLGITALEKSRALWLPQTTVGKHSATTRATIPDSASCACLLGKLYREFDDRKRATVCFEESLRTNPFMWDAFTALCDMGVNLRTTNIFKTNEALQQGFEPDARESTSSPQKDTTSKPLDPAPKRAGGRFAPQELPDPFEVQPAVAGNDMVTGNQFLSADTGENDFMSKINAARTRMVANAVSGPGLDTAEAPPSTSLDTSHQSRFIPPADPHHGAARKTRNVDAVPDASYKVGNSRLATRRTRAMQEKGQEDGFDAPPVATRAVSSTISAYERKRTASGHPISRQQSEEVGAPRRSNRLNTSRSNNVKTISGSSTVGAGATRELKKARPPISRLYRPTSAASVGRIVSGNRKPAEDSGMDIDRTEAPRAREPYPQGASVKHAEYDAMKTEETLRYLLDLLKKFGTGYYDLSQYRNMDAVAIYASLPKAHQDTPWVLAQTGRAYYEQAAYTEAETCFRRLRILAPTRLEDMEVYSTILWFLKRETDLSYLAHDLVDSSWHSPQAWCALGNAWSLTRDHEQALRCFKRATQLNPKFAYAFTLQGHEHVANEEYEKALTVYRQAISADRRHYNAYYGIGRVYERLGNYDKALIHFHSAAVINPGNAVLICCIGTIFEKQRHLIQALHYYNKAVDLAPKAAQSRYKKARALMALNQLEAAHRELEMLQTIAPNEATVHFLLGKLYKATDNKSLAVRHLTIALNLDPKASHQIKEAIESLEEDNNYDDSMIT